MHLTQYVRPKSRSSVPKAPGTRVTLLEPVTLNQNPRMNRASATGNAAICKTIPTSTQGDLNQSMICLNPLLIVMPNVTSDRTK